MDQREQFSILSFLGLGRGMKEMKRENTEVKVWDEKQRNKQTKMMEKESKQSKMTEQKSGGLD